MRRSRLIIIFAFLYSIFFLMFNLSCNSESGSKDKSYFRDFHKEEYLKLVHFDSLCFIGDTVIQGYGTIPEGMSELEAIDEGLVYQDTFTLRNKSLIESDSIKYCKYGFDVSFSLFKALKTEHFKYTLISTKEFEKRMKVIQSLGIVSDDILMIYLNNLDKNLWEIDSIVYTSLDKSVLLKNRGNSYYLKAVNIFKAFSKLKETNVKDRQVDSAYISKIYKKPIILK